jgi:hypothetical protein
VPGQVQQVMLAQLQQQQLAAQVAAMRVMAKTNPGSVTAPGDYNTVSTLTLTVTLALVITPRPCA